jgi:SAM-dependent methyltransferase
MSDSIPDEEKLRGLDRLVGAQHYRAYVGRPERYDVLAVLQFKVLTDLGLREHHNVLDLGCGSLRVGRLLIPFLLPNRYVGVEPERWLVEDGIKYELGESILAIKRPQFCFDGECELDHFGRSFDFILAQSVFTHAPLDWIERCSKRLAIALARPNGIVVATYLDGQNNYGGTDWVYPASIPYRRETLAALFAKVGFQVEGLEYPHPAGVSWVLIRQPRGE